MTLDAKKKHKTVRMTQFEVDRVEIFMRREDRTFSTMGCILIREAIEAREKAIPYKSGAELVTLESNTE